eukprot:NODE_92_length_21543_cov_0.719036.p15 type:complete len:142 gc:universal NODE_92_length_21543_cov_0.719036:6499-6074(-)
MDINPPTTKKELQSFLGLANYFRHFIKNESLLTSNLTKLLTKSAKFDWGPLQQESFLKIKSLMAERTLLIHPNPNKKFYLFCDASDRAVGVIVVQDKNPIYFYSKTLISAESRYSTLEKEFYFYATCCMIQKLKHLQTIRI